MPNRSNINSRVRQIHHGRAKTGQDFDSGAGLKPAALTRVERETIITWDEDRGTATCYSCSKPVMRRLRAVAGKMKAEVRESWPGIEVELPIACIRVAAKRVMSDEARAAAGARLKAVRESQQIRA
jgi:hypothetical protein